MATVFTKPAVVGRHELIAPDAERAHAFYRDLLGLDVDVVAQGDWHPHWLVYFDVADVDVVAAKVQALGGRVLHGPADCEETGRYALLADPEGATFAVVTGREPADRALFDWDELDTTEVEAAKEFYREVFGWTVDQSTPGYWLFKAGETPVAGLMEKPEEAPVPAWLTYLKAEDVDAVAERAPQLGGRVLVPPFQLEGVGRWAVLADPQGAVFAAIHPEG